MNARRKLLACVSAATLALTATAANAAVLIEGTGFWLTGTPTTSYSRANQSFQFSFTVPDTIPTGNGVASTSTLGDFSYTLNNVAKGAASQVVFYNAANGGLFDIVFGDNAVTLFGADIGSDGTVGPSGGYAFTSSINGAATTTGFGFVTVTALDPDPVAAVPEPATWGMMLLGFGMIGFGMRRRKTNVRTSVRFA